MYKLNKNLPDLSMTHLSNNGWECPKCGSVYSPNIPSCFKCISNVFANNVNVGVDSKSIRDALQSLVDLKDYKDKHGKDEFYMVRQQFVWERARDVLRKLQKGL